MPKIIKSKERWFDYPDDPLNGRIKIKHLSPGEIDEINDKVFNQSINYKIQDGPDGGKPSPEVVQKNDPRLHRELPVQLAVVDWENFYDEDDKELEFSSENVLTAIRQIEDFVFVVNDCRAILAKDIVDEKEKQLKNLKGSASEPAK